MKFRTIVASVALPLAVAGCGLTTDYDIKELKETTPGGTPFTQALAREYLAFSEAERAQYDWVDSQFFARKGLAAAKGNTVLPEEPKAWDIDDAKALQDLQAARQSLMGVIQAGAPNRAPALTATAQVKYDCWVEQQEEGWQSEHIAACRKDFETAMAALTRQPAPQPAVGSPATDLNRFQVYFDFDRSFLTETAQQIVREAAKTAQGQNVPNLTVVGHADRAGPSDYNIRLSQRRAQAVKDALVKAGYPANRIAIEAKGEADPIVPTEDGVRQPQNRRAVVQFR